MQCLLPSGLSSSNDTADLDPTTASSEPGDPEPAEPWKERVKRWATQLGEQKWWDFSTQKWAPRKCIRTFPNNPLLGSPAIGFFCHPNWGLLWWVIPPPLKNGRRPVEKHVVDHTASFKRAMFRSQKSGIFQYFHETSSKHHESRVAQVTLSIPTPLGHLE